MCRCVLIIYMCVTYYILYISKGWALKQFVSSGFSFFLFWQTKRKPITSIPVYTITTTTTTSLPSLPFYSSLPATLDRLFWCTGGARWTNELIFSLSSFAVRWYLCQAIGQKPTIANVVFSKQCGKCTTAGRMRRSNTGPPLRSFIQK